MGCCLGGLHSDGDADGFDIDGAVLAADWGAHVGRGRDVANLDETSNFVKVASFRESWWSAESGGLVGRPITEL
jgi:hypothetical protein